MKKILLVDDVRLFLEMEKNILNKRGEITVFTATSAMDALKLLKTERIDVILCDLYMPEMNGDELCKMVRRDNAIKDIPFIIVTSSDSQEDIDRCKEAGANDYFSKPIIPANLLKKVASHIDISIRESERISVRIAVMSDTAKREIGATLDMSSGGFFLETDTLFEIGAKEVFSFVIPGYEKRMAVSCEVVRKASGRGSDSNYYGIRFVDIPEDGKQIIEDYVKKHPEKRV